MFITGGGEGLLVGGDGNLCIRIGPSPIKEDILSGDADLCSREGERGGILM